MHISTLSVIGYNSFRKNPVCFFPLQSPSDWIWPCCKIGRQTRSNKGHHLNKLGRAQVLIAIKFQGHWPFGSWEKDFQRFLPYMGIRPWWWPSWLCDPDIMHKLLFTHPMEVPYVIWFQLAQQFQRCCWCHCGWRCWCRHSHQRLTTDHCLYYKLHLSLWWAKHVTSRVLTRFSFDLTWWPSLWPQVTQFQIWHRSYQDKHFEQYSWWLLLTCNL